MNAELPRPLTDAEREDIAALVRKMTVEQKASLTAGRDMWGTNAVAEAGIPSWRMTDGPNGARGTMWGPAGVRALCMPSGSALGASWDVELIHEIGVALGRETRARSARVLLATVNVQRSPLGGRTFECFAEDPHLAGKLAAAYIRGVQSQGVVTTVKHLAGNEAEFERNSIDSIVDERTLREIYLAPFETAIREGGSLGVMTSYNRLNGSFCANSRWLLHDLLRDEWGFDGIVVTDWWALSSTVDAADAGLDIEMPGPGRSFGPDLARAVDDGSVAEATLDEIVERVLSVMHRIDAAEDESDGPEFTLDDPDLIALARRAAAESMVLFKNDHELLPLSPAALGTVAVIGPNANRSQIMGGGSASLRAHHRTSPLTALRAHLPDVDVVFQPGCDSGERLAALESTELTTPDGEAGIEVAFFAGPRPDGAPLAVHRGDSTQLFFMGEPAQGVPAESFSIRAAARFTPVHTGTHEFALTTNSEARLLLDGQVVAEAGWGKPARNSSEREAAVHVELVAGRATDLVIEFAGDSANQLCRVSVGCTPPAPADEMDVAVAAAAEADVAILVVGTSQSVETEGDDRIELALPGHQDELIRRVLAAENPRTVVVVNSGSPVEMPWLADASAVIQTWFSGQEMADALADVLLGVTEPGGPTPISFPRRIEDTPAFGNFPGEAGVVRYGEGVFVGYRWYEARLIEPAVPFGHGLGYTRFEWSGAAASAATIAPGAPVTISLDVENVGARSGADVVQVYVEPPAGPLGRPTKELRGFAKVHLAPGERQRVEIELSARDLAYWHPGDDVSIAIQSLLEATPFARLLDSDKRTRGWTVEPGEYVVHIARSSVDIVDSLTVDVDGLLQGLAS